MRMRTFHFEKGTIRIIALIAIAGLLAVALAARIIAGGDGGEPVVVEYGCDSCDIDSGSIPAEAVIYLESDLNPSLRCPACGRGELRPVEDN